tara:strand:+ start:666 stop:899 length:234 start_codon:yes stop_codon:yes gene_type:complete
MTYEYKVEQFYNVDGKRDGWAVTEVKAGSFHEYCIDIYPTKAQANKVAKQHADMLAKSSSSLQAKPLSDRLPTDWVL